MGLLNIFIKKITISLLFIYKAQSYIIIHIICKKLMESTINVYSFLYKNDDIQKWIEFFDKYGIAKCT